MGQSDWDEVAGGLTFGSEVLVAPTGGLGVSPDGGSFVLAAGIFTSVGGTWALCSNAVTHAPAAAGGSATGLLRRGLPDGANAGAAPFLFVSAAPAPSDPTMDSVGYILGLSDEAEGSRVVLAKATLASGVPASAVGEDGVLGRGSVVHPIGGWHHLRLVVVWNTTGDVALSVYESDLAVHAPSSPSWERVPGIDLMIDDALGQLFGTPGLHGGFMGIGARHVATRAVACFDRIELHAEA